MEWVFFGAFAFVAAILFNAVNPKITAMSWAQTAGAKGFIGRTAVTAVAFFVVLTVASIAMAALVKKPVLPSA